MSTYTKGLTEDKTIESSIKPVPGDVLLFRGTGLVSKVLDYGQRLRFRTISSQPSHVAIYVGQATVYESTGSKGVDLSFAGDINLQGHAKWFRAFRYDGLSALLSKMHGKTPLASSLMNSLEPRMGKRYKFPIVKWPSDGFFCSEVIALLMSELGVHIREQRSDRTYPGHFFKRLLSDPRWKEVTRAYKVYDFVGMLNRLHKAYASQPTEIEEFKSTKLLITKLASDYLDMHERTKVQYGATRTARQVTAMLRLLHSTNTPSDDWFLRKLERISAKTRLIK